MPIPVDLRRIPARVNVHVSSGAGVDITWSDGHSSHYDFTYLREECPCAMCNDERQKKGNATPSTSGVASSAALPMFKPKPKASSAHAVGNYALQIEFTDGHSTGIYSFEYLRIICPCDACAQKRRAESADSPR